MLNKIIDFSIKNKLIVALFTLALIGVGIHQVKKLPIDAVPDITDNQVQVITQAPSYGAEDIERLVTFPIEQNCSNISGIKEIRSFSRFGLSLVTIVFNDDIDVYWARQQIAEKLIQAKAQIPTEIGNPEIGPISTGLGEIYQYVVRPKKGFEKKYDAIALRTIQDWIVRRQLLGVQGVAEVSSFGGKLKQYEIAVNPNKLNSLGITIKDVFTALETNNQNTGGAYIDKGPQVLFIRSEGLIRSIDDIKNIAIQKQGMEVPIFIKDIADVQIGFATRYGAMCYNDQGEVAGAIVMMLKGANSNEVIENVKTRVEQIKQTLPEGVTIEPFLDRTKMVNNAISTVKTNLLEGALIVIFVLVLFLGNLRAGLLVASVIPLSLLFAITLMNMFGVSGNLMSLGALDFGLIIDGAVIIVEAVMHLLFYSKNATAGYSLQQNDMDDIVSKSSKKMMNSAVFGQIIILIVYLPIFTLEGVEGKMFKPMAQTVAFALLGAFILSLTYVPMMASIILPKKIKNTPNISDSILNAITKQYSKLLVKALHFPKVILITTVILFISSLVVFTFLGGEFIPALEEGDFAVDTRVLTGSNLNTTIEYTQKAAKILKNKFPEVEKVVTKIGSGEVPTDPMPMEASDMMVILKDKSKWTSAKTFPELEQKMSAALADVLGITAGFQFPVQMRFNELMTGARQDVVCKIYGENLDSLVIFADKLASIIKPIKGVQDLYIEPITGMQQVVITFNKNALAQYQINITDANKIINASLAGQSTGLLFEDEKRFDVVVKINAEAKKSIKDIQNLLIPTPKGVQIPLYTIADVLLKNGVNQIQREDAKRRIIVGFNVDGRDVQSIVNELKQNAQALKLAPGYYVRYGGSFENLEKAKGRLLIAVPIALLLIFLLLFFAFNSVKQSLLIYTAIPLSTIGGILFLALRGMPFSISAGIGFIALFGVAVLNGIVLLSEFNFLKSTGITSLPNIILRGTATRLRPVLMTACVASLGFLPMALSNGAGAEVQRPLATVVIGGLIIATLLTLFVLPILYILSEKWKPKSVKKKAVFAIVLALFSLQNINAQIPITLQQALDTVQLNNQKVRLLKNKEEYAASLIKSANKPANTNIFSEFGQVNSALFDTKFGINQSFILPKVLMANKNIATQEYNKSLLNGKLTVFELKKAVSNCFIQYQYLQAKQKYLTHWDSVYIAFLSKAKIRVQLGESNRLEKLSAENQLNAIKEHQLLLNTELENTLIEFNYLLNSPNKLIPKFDMNKYILQLELDSNTIKRHPIIQLLFLDIEMQKAITQQEKAKLLPELIGGINNSSFRGIGPNNVDYNWYNRFTSVQFGLSIPLFNKTQKLRIQSAKVAENIAQQQVNIAENELKNQFIKLYNLQQTHLQNIAKYESEYLPNAKAITNTAFIQYQKGEVNYLDFVMLINQAVSIESKYIETINEFNKTIVELNYLSLK